MIRISRYFENPFDDRQIAAEELRIFAEDHLGKVNSHNDSGPLAGTLTAMVTATEAAFDPFDEALSGRAQEIGTQMGGTMTKDDALRLFKTKIRQREGTVRGVLAENTPQYREIFPGGLMYYTRATMQTIQARLDYAVEKFTKYQAELGAAVVAEITGLRSAFSAARDAQVGDKGEVSEARGMVKTTRRSLELQLLDNLLALAKLFKGQPEKAAEFFNQSLLEDPQHTPVPPNPA